MAFDAFLKLTGVKGESSDTKHAGEIEIDSYQWGASQIGTAAFGGGQGSGKVQMNDFHFTKKTDTATPTLFIRCADGKPMADGTLTLRKAGGDQQEYLKVKFKNVTVSSITQGGSAGGHDVPSENITLNFEEIKYEYLVQQADGSLKPGGEFGYNLKKMAPA